MPVRRIPISHNSITGRHAMGAGRNSIGFESTLERDFVSLMLFDPDVISIEEQPVRINFANDEGCKRHYTPDYLVQRNKAPTLLAEIKPRKFLTPDLEPKFNAARHYATDHDWVFEIWTEREIRTPRLKNIRFLLPYQRQSPDPGRSARILRQINMDEHISVEDVLSACWTDETERAFGQSALWQLLATGQLKANLDQELTPQTILHGPRRSL